MAMVGALNGLVARAGVPGVPKVLKSDEDFALTWPIPLLQARHHARATDGRKALSAYLETGPHRRDEALTTEWRGRESGQRHLRGKKAWRTVMRQWIRSRTVVVVLRRI